MFRFVFIFLFSILPMSCLDTSNQNTELPLEKEVPIVGIWAMIPLKNGIANVVEFTREGKSNLYSFNCREELSLEKESSIYTISDDRNNINLKSNHKIQSLKIVSIDKKKMILRQTVGKHFLNFSYMKTNRVAPFCSLYEKMHESKRTSFKEADFNHEPWIPDSPKILRYLGKWANEKGEIQIEVKQASDGRYKIYNQNNENWNYLYNSVNWSGEELRFQSFTYSDKQDLFEHPNHKSRTKEVLRPVDDINKIKWSFFIESKRFDYILIRK